MPSGKKRIDRTGSTLDSLLEEDGTLAAAEAVAIKRVIAWQLQNIMTAGKITKTAMARRLGTSRSQLDRLLDPGNATVQLDTIARAAQAIGKKLRIEMVEAGLAMSKAHDRYPRIKKRLPAIAGLNGGPRRLVAKGRASGAPADFDDERLGLP